MTSTILKITVTADDIAHGERRDCARCPVALAMSRALGKPTFVSGASWDATDPENPEEDVGGKVPWDVTEFIILFDDNVPVSPFEFEVKVGK